MLKPNMNTINGHEAYTLKILLNAELTNTPSIIPKTMDIK
jgi:hypothetical protein